MAQVHTPAAAALRVPLAASAFLAAVAAAGIGVGLLAALDPQLLHFQPSAVNVLALSAALGFGITLVWRPALALTVLILVVYLGLSDVLVRWHGVPSLLQALAVPLVIAAWRAQRAAGHRTWLPPALTLFLAGYAVIVWISTAWARDVAIADERAIAITKAWVLYVLVLLLAGSRTLLRGGVWTLVGAAALLGGLGVFQVLTGAYDQSFGGLARAEYAQIYGRVFEQRITGPLGDPNFFAQILIPAVPLGLSLAQGAQRLRHRVLALGVVVVAVAASILTYSRGGALALGLVLVLWLVLQGISVRRLAAGIVAVALLFATLPSDFTRRLTTFRQLVPERGDVLRLDSSFEQRRVLVTTAWQMFLDYPLTGVGAGNYTVHYSPYVEAASSVTLDYDESDRAYPHNLYLEIAAETGLPGLLLFGAALLSCFLYLKRARLRARAVGDEPLAALATGVQVALIGYLTTSLFLHGHFARYLWLLFGLCAAVYRVASVSTCAGEGQTALVHAGAGRAGADGSS